MEAFLAKLTWQVGVKILGVVALLGVLTYAGFKVKSYFDHVSQVEQANADLTKDNKTLTDQKNNLVVLNQQNEQSLAMLQEQIKDNQEIANQERAAAQARTSNYKGIHDAINSSPAPVVAVSPVITDTVAKLW